MNEDAPDTSICKIGKKCRRTVPVHIELGYGFDDIVEISLEGE